MSVIMHQTFPASSLITWSILLPGGKLPSLPQCLRHAATDLMIWLQNQSSTCSLACPSAVWIPLRSNILSFINKLWLAEKYLGLSGRQFITITVTAHLTVAVEQSYYFQKTWDVNGVVFIQRDNWFETIGNISYVSWTHSSSSSADIRK